MVNIFTAPEKEVTAQQMADSAPRGRAWAAKNIDSSNMRKMINSLAVAPNMVQQQIQLLDQEFRIEQSVALLPDWETSVGLPDTCFDGVVGTLEQRRNDVISRQKKEPIVSLAEIQAYMDFVFPDISFILYAGVTYLAANPGAFTDNPKFVIVAEIQTIGDSFEYEFEMPFIGGVDPSTIKCVMNKVISAHVLFLTFYA